MQNILLGSQNRGKLAEIQHILGSQFVLKTPAELGITLNVIEDGTTYAQNAARKARAYAEASGLVSLADDSGLEVDALEGRPGLRSARFAPQPEATDQDRRQVLIAALAGFPQPWTARFRCVVAVTQPGGDVMFTEGLCEGKIIPEERGNFGFGYDPIFLIPDRGMTMAELSMEVKNTLSHRALAVRAAVPYLEKLVKTGGL